MQRLKEVYKNISLKSNSTFGNIRNDENVTDSVNHSVVIGVLVSIVCIAVIGNTIVIYVISSDRKLHRSPFYFLLASAIMDLSKSIFCVPFIIEVVLSNFKWIYRQTTCNTLAFSGTFFTVSTAIGLLGIITDRYLSVTAPRFYSKCSHGLVTLAFIVLGWGVSFCISFPPIFEKGAYQFVQLEMQCTFHHLTYRDNKTLGYAISFICIMLVTLFLYSRLFLFMRAHRRMTPLYHEPARSSDWTFFGPGANGQALINLLNGFTGGPLHPLAANARNIQQNIGRVVNIRVIKNEHLIRLFFISSVTFIILWSPYLFQVFVNVFSDVNFLSPSFIIFSSLLSNSHVALNPVICLIWGGPLRTSIFSRFRERNQENNYTGVDQQDSDIPEASSVRCIELSV